jgi:hypothetical protein
VFHVFVQNLLPLALALLGWRLLKLLRRWLLELALGNSLLELLRGWLLKLTLLTLWRCSLLELLWRHPLLELLWRCSLLELLWRHSLLELLGGYPLLELLLRYSLLKLLLGHSLSLLELLLRWRRRVTLRLTRLLVLVGVDPRWQSLLATSEGRKGEH